MSGSSKRWELLFSCGLVASISILLSPNHARAGMPLTATKGAQADIATPKPVFERRLDQAQIAIIPSTQSPQTFAVGQFKVVGNTLLSAADLNSITQPITQQPITLITLNQVVNEITQFYAKRGFTTSRAVLPPQTLKKNGTVTLQVIEGWLGEIQVKGTRQLQPSYIESRLRLAAGAPLNLQRLEARIRLLSNDPMIERIETSLRAGTKPGESILRVTVKEADRVNKTFSTNNYGSSSGLPEKTRLSAHYRNLIGVGVVGCVFVRTATK